MKQVDSYIANISFPKTLDEFLYFLEDDFHFNVDDILNEKNLEWTAPRWIKKDDIVFFMHSKTAISTITKLRTEYNNNKGKYTNTQCKLIEKGIKHALDNYNKYGGKIYAIGRIIDPPIYDDFYTDDIELHWKGRIYAPISDVIVLSNPMDISEFNSFIFISRQSSITEVSGKEYIKLKEIIMSKNIVKDYFKNSIASVLPIKNVNESNWLQISSDFRRRFFLESQFRSYYVDYLLAYLTDNKVYRECTCKTENKPDCFVDNIITINNKPLLVEIKLNICNEKDLPGQMDKYCNCDMILLNKSGQLAKEWCRRFALVVDTEAIYVFDNNNKKISLFYKLNSMKKENDLEKLKKLIADKLNHI